jgi:hypothetical protein
MRLIRRLVEGLPAEICQRTCVVFDAANPPRDRPAQYLVEGLDVQFAVGYPEADDLLEELIAANSAPKKLAVVSSDGRVQLAAKRRSCTIFDSQAWLDDLLDGEVGLAVDPRGQQAGHRAGQGRGVSGLDDVDGTSHQIDAEAVEQWLREFGF